MDFVIITNLIKGNVTILAVDSFRSAQSAAGSVSAYLVTNGAGDPSSHIGATTLTSKTPLGRISATIARTVA
jgi:hypothetical protein